MRKITTVLIIVLVLFSLPVTIYAQKDNQRDVVLTKEQVINKDYFATGNSVTLAGTVNGDAYVAGGNVIVDGTVNGDLIAAGGNLDVKGTVTGNIRAAGANININGIIGKNATLVGGSINLSSNANIKGSLVSAGGNLAILAPVGKEANLAAGGITLGNKVGGDVNAAVDRISLTSTATVSGNLTYLSKNTASLAPEATVSGRITQNLPQVRQTPQEVGKRGLIFFSIFSKATNLILSAIIGSLLISFLPIYFEITSKAVANRPWFSLGIGFLTVIVFPIAFILLAITIIGLPVAFALAFILAIFLYLAKIFVVYVIGRLIVKRFTGEDHKIWAFLTGLAIYIILTSIPVLGGIVSAVVGLMGLGAILIADKNLYSQFRAKQII